MAPELFTICEEEEFIPRVTVGTDVWAFGMTVTEVRLSPLSHSCFNKLI